MRIFLFLTTLFLAEITRSQNCVYLELLNADLVCADIDNCTYQYIGNTGVFMYDIAICSDGTLYGITTEALYTINTTNAQATLVLDSITGNSLVCDNSGKLYTIGGYGIPYVHNNFLSIDASTFQVTTIDSVGINPLGDLTFYDGTLLTIGQRIGSGTVELDKVSLTPPYLQTVGVLPQEKFSNGFGMATVISSDCRRRMFIFSESDVYEVSPYDGSFHLVCQNLLNGVAVGGAASTTEFDNVSDCNNDFVFPNVFTPNNDGKNDLFFPILKSTQTLSAFHIYNRWGQLVYKNSSHGWDGKFENAEQPAGTYIYYAVVRSSDSNEPTGFKETNATGAVTLLR